MGAKRNADGGFSAEGAEHIRHSRISASVFTDIVLIKDLGDHDRGVNAAEQIAGRNGEKEECKKQNNVFHHHVFAVSANCGKQTALIQIKHKSPFPPQSGK